MNTKGEGNKYIYDLIIHQDDLAGHNKCSMHSGGTVFGKYQKGLPNF